METGGGVGVGNIQEMAATVTRALLCSALAVAGCGGHAPDDAGVDAGRGDAALAPDAGPSPRDAGGLDDAGASAAETIRDEAYGPLDDPALPNPERGIYYWGPRDDDAHTLIGAWLYLGDHCDEELVWDGPEAATTSPALAAYAAALVEHRDAGRKVIFRPRYDAPSSDGLNRCGVFQAADEALMRRHVEAIADLLAAHRDVVAFVEAGYLGRWGEWNHAGHGPETAPVLVDPARRRAFLDFVIRTNRAAGLARRVGARRPVFARELRESFAGSAPWVSLYNDCFMTNDTDMGTYSNAEPDNPFNFASADEAVAYARALSADVPFGGETCPAPDPRWASCDAMVGPGGEPESLHLTYLHGAWADTARATWEAGGCYDMIRQRLGYRFEIVAVEYPPEVTGAQRAVVRVHVRNTGWARMHNPRRAVLVLSSGGEPVEATEIAGDAVERWRPGETSVLEATFEDVPAGNWRVRLALPDPDRPDVRAYAVRIASARDGAPLFDEAMADHDLGVAVSVSP